MRDKLIELIKQSVTVCEDGACPMYTRGGEVEELADYLIANGVILPPCKVGDVVYCLDDIREGEATEVCPLMVKKIFIDVRGFKVYADGTLWSAVLRTADFGETVFLAMEEAERALREVQGDA